MLLSSSILESFSSPHLLMNLAWLYSHSGNMEVLGCAKSISMYLNVHFPHKIFMFSCLFSLNDVVVPEEGVMAFVNISKDGFFSYSYERMIFSYAIEEFDWQVLTSLLGSIGFIHNQLDVYCFGVLIFLRIIISNPRHISQGSSHCTLALSR